MPLTSASKPSGLSSPAISAGCHVPVTLVGNRRDHRIVAAVERVRVEAKAVLMLGLGIVRQRIVDRHVVTDPLQPRDDIGHLGIAAGRARPP